MAKHVSKDALVSALTQILADQTTAENLQEQIDTIGTTAQNLQNSINAINTAISNIQTRYMRMLSYGDVSLNDYFVGIVPLPGHSNEANTPMNWGSFVSFYYDQICISGGTVYGRHSASYGSWGSWVKISG